MPNNQEFDLNLFIKLFQEIDPAQCIHTDVPDLLASYRGRTLGIEHTRLYRKDAALPDGQQMLPQEKLHAQLAERSRQFFHEYSNQSLYVTIDFDEPFNYQRSDVEEVAQELAQSVLDMTTRGREPDAYSSAIWVFSWQARQLGIPFPKGVHCYGYRVEQNPAYELWSPSYGYPVPELSTQRIADVISEKESRIDSYRARCDVIWLLMVTGVGMPSSHYDIPDDVSQYPFTTSFDRVFLLEPFHQRLLELRTQRIESS
jgi:hypothetical protein